MNSQVAKLNNPRQLLLFAAVFLILILLAQLGSSENFKVRNVSALEAKQLIDSGAVVVDVRGPESYAGRHIPGAISVPLATLREEAVPGVIAHAIAKPVVVYCGDGVSIGPEGTALLNKAGFTKAVNLEHGIQGWADAGYSVVKPDASGA
jgi:rhodanese-related sulfurtransferase